MTACLSQEELAERAGLSARGISDLERGARRFPHPATIQRLAVSLHLAPTERAALVAAARRARRGTILSPEPPRPSLLTPLTSFVGRHEELAEVRRLLTSTRLLTLTGAGGVGKTRLALETVRAVAGDYTDGTWMAELAALADPALVPQAVAAALGISDEPGRLLRDMLVAHLRTTQTLLVLDNCEHLIVACAELADFLLGHCPELRILTTSRGALDITGEVAWPVPSLSLPASDHPSRLDELANSEAVRLFVERAQRVAPHFILTDETAEAVAQVCARLDPTGDRARGGAGQSVEC